MRRLVMEASSGETRSPEMLLVKEKVVHAVCGRARVRRGGLCHGAGLSEGIPGLCGAWRGRSGLPG